MKLGTPFYILLIIAFAFSSIALIVADFRTNYPEAGDVSTSYEDKYNYLNAINGSFLDISQRLKELGETETSGWRKLLGGLIVIPLAAIAVIIQLGLSIPHFVTILSGISVDIGLPGDIDVPGTITAVAIMAITGAVIIMLVRFAYKSTTV